MPVQKDSLPPQEWDVVLTCFEPLVRVTGGIGTYHRLLLTELKKTDKKVLVLTRGPNLDLSIFGDKIHSVDVDEYKPKAPYNFVGLDHEFFSLHCHFALKDLYDAGHRFNFIEFSDYGCDGYYPLRARACGVYSFGIAAVRLHSPEIMLIHDNGKQVRNAEDYVLDRIDREMSAYQDCDVVLYGGDAMLERVANLCDEYAVNIRDKAIKVPHPYPRDLFKDTPNHVDAKSPRETLFKAILSENNFTERAKLDRGTFIGIFGRIEDRKGQYQFLDYLLNDQRFVDEITSKNLHIVVAGHSVLDTIGNYKLNDLYSLIHEKGVQDRIHFTGRVDQTVLAEFSRVVSGYIFPSIFENYPNALLEVLPTTKPIAISSRGCMVEMTSGFSNITVFDPLDLETETILSFLREIKSVKSADSLERARRKRTLEARSDVMISFYQNPHSKPSSKETERSDKLLTVGFVVPTYGDPIYLAETLQSISECMSPGDEIVVVDDGSSKKFAGRAKRISERFGARFETLKQNSGPNAARLHGATLAETDLIQFCDADDMLDPDGIKFARLGFTNDPKLDALTGIMRCFQDARHYWVPRNGFIWTAINANFAHSGGLFRRATIISALEKCSNRLPLNEDWLTNLVLLAQGAKCRMLPEVTYHYRRTSDTRSTKNQSMIGYYNERILLQALGLLTFTSAEQNSRIRELLKRSNSTPSPLGGTTNSGRYPLRYQMADDILMLARRLPFSENVLPRVKRALQRRKR